MAHLHKRTRRQIERHFTTGLGAGARRSMYDQVAECNACADYFNLHHAAEDALSPEAAVSPWMLDRVENAVLQSAPVKSQRTPYWYARVVGAVAAAAAVLALVLTVQWTGSGPRPHRMVLDDYSGISPVEFTARGSHVENAADYGVRLFAVTDRSEGPSERPALSPQDIITFTYTRAVPGAGYLTLFGLQGPGDVRWYYPDVTEDRSRAIEGNKIDEPLGDGIDLRVNHSAGELVIVALFTDEPIDKAQIEMLTRYISAASASLLPMLEETLDGLEIDAVVQILDLPILDEINDGPSNQRTRRNAP